MGKFDNLLDKSRPVDTKHPAMSLHNRAAQFAPFDALTGLSERIYEASRITSERIELSEEAKQVINEQLCFLEAHTKEHPEITVTYFIPDITKDGGAYKTITATLHKIKIYDERLILNNGLTIAFDDITELDGDIFNNIDFT